tara:strand:+ start:1605 stop:1754 length:150 start_codon:yes stop_codon:yes gene_type:complete
MMINKDKEKTNDDLRDMMPTSEEAYDYDSMWGVSGYYNDNNGNDIRDRD